MYDTTLSVKCITLRVSSLCLLAHANNGTVNSPAVRLHKKVNTGLQWRAICVGGVQEWAYTKRTRQYIHIQYHIKYR